MASILDRPLRSGILAAAESPVVRRAVTRYGMRLGAARFVAGETAEQFLPVAAAVNARGFSVAATILGESVRDREQTAAVTAEYRRLLESFANRELDANVAFKLTHVGLDIDPELAFANATKILAVAEKHARTVRMDMEQSRYVDPTLAIYRRLRERYEGVGFVLQSYLYRSAADLAALLPLAPNVRIVKGAYLESPEIAYPQKRDVDANYIGLAETALSHDGYTAIATHDAAIVDHLAKFAATLGLPKRGRFEFQMLYGIAEPLARRTLERGYRVRLSVPYGDNWFPYLMRRLAERPANVAFFLKGALAFR
ncbi:MAG: proline dehydrogenase family protein [Candidatus Eremiobacteraeota bacterium]|nr:proline dehydrogenase family protein [Candidatus Eremiobacteraeota bacterium]